MSDTSKKKESRPFILSESLINDVFYPSAKIGINLQSTKFYA